MAYFRHPCMQWVETHCCMQWVWTHYDLGHLQISSGGTCWVCETWGCCLISYQKSLSLCDSARTKRNGWLQLFQLVLSGIDDKLFNSLCKLVYSTESSITQNKLYMYLSYPGMLKLLLFSRVLSVYLSCRLSCIFHHPTPHSRLPRPRPRHPYVLII